MKHNPTNRFYILLFFLFIFHCINNYIILSIDNIPLVGHSGDNFAATMKFYNVLTEGPQNLINLFLHFPTSYPPLFMLLPISFLLIFGQSLDIAVMFNCVYLFILIFSTYGIGKIIHSRAAGALAAFLVCSFPIIFGFSRMYWPDFAMTAFVALSIWLLLKTGYFQSRKYSILFGISVGIGLLIKWPFIFYVIGPLLIYQVTFCYRAIVKTKDSTHVKIWIKNCLFSIAAALLLCGPWYVVNFRRLFRVYIIEEKMFARNFIQSPWDILGNYIGFLAKYQIHRFFYVLFIPCFLYFLLAARRKRGILLLWILTPCLFIPLICFFNKAEFINLIVNARYTMAALPAVALIISISIFKIFPKRPARIFCVLVILFGLIQFFHFSYGTNPSGEFTTLDMDRRAENTGLLNAEHVDWNLEEILEILNRPDKQQRFKPVTVVVVPNSPFSTALMYLAKTERMPIRFLFPLIFITSYRGVRCQEDYNFFISKADFIFLHNKLDDRVDRLEVPIEEAKAEFRSFLMALEQHRVDFEQIKKIYINKKCDLALSVYKRKGE